MRIAADCAALPDAAPFAYERHTAKEIRPKHRVVEAIDVALWVDALEAHGIAWLGF